MYFLNIYIIIYKLKTEDIILFDICLYLYYNEGTQDDVIDALARLIYNTSIHDSFIIVCKNAGTPSWPSLKRFVSFHTYISRYCASKQFNCSGNVIYHRTSRQLEASFQRVGSSMLISTTQRYNIS